MTGNDYNLALSLFFVKYILFEVPSNIALRKIPPSWWFSFIIGGWGLVWISTTLLKQVMIFMGFVHNLAGLIVARVFLGLLEAGYFPGVAFYLTLWYRRQEHSFRLALFFTMATMAGAFGGVFAFGIGHMGGVGGKAGWAWIFM